MRSLPVRLSLPARLTAVSVPAMASTQHMLDEHRHFRALSVDLKGQPLTRAEFDQASDMDGWFKDWAADT